MRQNTEILQRTLKRNIKLKKMTVKELIKSLVNMPEDKIVVLTDPDGVGWDNIGNVYEDGSCIKITMDGNNLFDN